MKRKQLRTILLVLFIIVFCVSAFMLAFIKFRGEKEQSAFENIAEMVQAADETPDPGAAGDVTLPKYRELHGQNPDFAAWLRIPGTDVDYPVMCTPDEPNYYLRRAFDGSSSVSGTPFIGLNCNTDSDCIIVHGHNMKNGTMFGTLGRFEDEEFYKDNPTIYFDTLFEEREYKVFAAVKCEVIAFGQDGYKYYDHGGELDDEEFTQLVGWLIGNSMYNTGEMPAPNTQLLLLSTCSYHNTDGRFVVAAYRVG